MKESVDYGKLRGVQKAAILMTVLGDDAATILLRNLPEPDLQVITREITGLGRVPAGISQQVLQVYHRMRVSAHRGKSVEGRRLASAIIPVSPRWGHAGS